MPLYPGHGRTPEEFFRSRASQWVGSARDAFLELRSACSSVAIVGLSMGAAIAAVLASELEGVAALVLIAPYVGMPLELRMAAATQWIWGRFAGTMKSRSPESIRNPEEAAKNLGYGVINGRTLRELWRVARWGRAALPKVVSPTLVVQSRHDPRVAPKVALDAFKRVGAEKKKLVWLEEGGHIITVDYGRETVFSETIAWLLGGWAEQPAGFLASR